MSEKVEKAQAELIERWSDFHVAWPVTGDQRALNNLIAAVREEALEEAAQALCAYPATYGEAASVVRALKEKP